MKNFKPRQVLIGLMCALTQWAAHAAQPPEQVSFDQLIGLIQLQSPRLELERQTVRSVYKDLDIASAYLNPTLSTHRFRQPGALTNYGSRDARDVSLDIPLLVGGQRDARREAALKSIDLSKARYWLSANDLATESGATWIGLLMAQQKRMLAQSTLADLERIQAVVSARQQSGLASNYDMLRVDLELAGFRSKVAEAQIDVLTQQGQLATLLGLPGWKPTALGVLEPLPGVSAKLDPADVPPLTLATRLDEQVAQSNVEVARRERTPAFSLNMSRFTTTSPDGSTNVVGLSVEIPILDTRKAPLDKARIEAQSATLRRQLSEAALESNRALYETQVDQRSQTLQQYQTQVGERLKSLRQMSVDAYQLGRTSILELLDATRTRYETQTNLIELTGNLMEAQVRLQGLGGKLLNNESIQPYQD